MKYRSERSSSSLGPVKAGWSGRKMIFKLISLYCFQFMMHLDTTMVPAFSMRIIDAILDMGHSKNADLFLSLLHASTFIGMALAAPIVALLSKNASNLGMITIGMHFWLINNFSAGCFALNRWYLWMGIMKVSAGLGQAVMKGIFPAILRAECRDWLGTALGIYHALAPIGVASGFAFCAVWNFFQWPWKYTLIVPSLSCIPAATYMLHAVRKEAIGKQKKNLEEMMCMDEEKEKAAPLRHSKLVMEAFRHMLSYSFLAAVVAAAAHTGACSIFSLYGVSFSVKWGVFESEAMSQIALGLVISFGGALGTIVGGLIIDALRKRKGENASRTGMKRNLDNDDIYVRDYAPSSIQVMATLLFFATILSIVCLILCPMTVMKCVSASKPFQPIMPISQMNRSLFVMSIFLALIFLFIGLPIISLLQLATVPHAYHPIVLSFGLFIGHIVGDVLALVTAGHFVDSYSNQSDDAAGLLAAWWVAVCWLSVVPICSITIWARATINKKIMSKRFEPTCIT